MAGLFIRMISGASKSTAPGEQFGWIREIKGKVFIMVDLFLTKLLLGIFSVSQMYIQYTPRGSMAIVTGSFTWKWRLSPGKGKLVRSRNLFRAPFSLPLPPLRVRWEMFLGFWDMWEYFQVIIPMKDLFLQTHAPLFLGPQPWVQVSLIWWVREEEKGKSNLEKWFGLVQFSVGQPDNKLGRP